MICVRDVFRVTFGATEEFVALFRELDGYGLAGGRIRVLADASGDFGTVATEREAESRAAFAAARAAALADARFAPWFARLKPLVEGGRREFWRVAHEQAGAPGAARALRVRETFRCRYGAGDLVPLLAEALPWEWPGIPVRILEDASGRFFTTVLEADVESVGAWEENVARAFADPHFAPWFARTLPLVEEGAREFFHILTR
jgi:hypothetical protein